MGYYRGKGYTIVEIDQAIKLVKTDTKYPKILAFLAFLTKIEKKKDKPI